MVQFVSVEVGLRKQTLVLLGSLVAAGMANGPAASKPIQTTKYVYYPISGETPAAIYATMVSHGPRVDGVKAYASTNAVSAQSGLMTQGDLCVLKYYKFKIDFTINLPRLKNESTLKRRTKTEWKKFSRFLKTHEETHRSIWLACGSALEAQVQRLKIKSCKELDTKTVKLWDQMRASCAKKQDAFDVAEQKRLPQQSFVRLVLSQIAHSSKALAVPQN